MNGQVPGEATCAICGRHFDPSKTRGWCPNPSCGQWQHPAFPIGDEDASGADAAKGAGHTARAPMRECPNCGQNIRADAAFCKHCAFQLDEADEAEEVETEGPITECPDCGADLSGIPADRLAKCPICLFDLAPVIDQGEEAVAETNADTTANAAESESAAFTECPNCAEDLTPIPPDLRTVCPGCRIDLDDAAEPATGAMAAADATADSGDTALEELDYIADGYVRRLADAGIHTLQDLAQGNPDAIAPKTGISSRRIREWIEEAPGDLAAPEPQPTRTGPASTELDAQATKIQRSPDELVLEVMGREIEVTDGAEVGREVRKAMVEAGAPEEDAVFVHRKHVRVEFDDEGFRLTRLGENSVTVNGRTVEKGAQVRIDDGDRIRFSDVVEAIVSVR